jgi:hypothetical protein
MKLGMIEVSGIKRVVEDHKVVWERYPKRWVKYVKGVARTGMSEAEMSEYLDNKIYAHLEHLDNGFHAGYRVWVHNETINVERCK